MINNRIYVCLIFKPRLLLNYFLFTLCILFSIISKNDQEILDDLRNLIIGTEYVD